MAKTEPEPALAAKMLERAALRAERVALLNAAGADKDEEGDDESRTVWYWGTGRGDSWPMAYACSFLMPSRI